MFLISSNGEKMYYSKIIPKIITPTIIIRKVSHQEINSK